MAVSITTSTGNFTPTKYNSQRRLAECANGVLWTAIVRTAINRLEFWYSTTQGATWAEDTSQRITGVKQNAGASLSISTRADGEERLGVTYVDDNTNRVDIALGKFNGSSRTSFTWQSQRSVSYESSTQFLNPDCRVFTRSGYWIIAVVWSREISDKTRLYFGRVKYTDTNNGWGLGSDTILHERVSSLHTYPTIDVRHSSGIVESTPDLYVAWAQGDGNSEEGTPADPQPRQYLMRLAPASGETWVKTVVRPLRESGTGPDPGAASCSAAIYSGYAFACVRSPRGDADDTLQLHTLDPQDTVRSVVDVPALNKGDILNVGITYDPYNGDLFILANGNSVAQLSMITYRWAVKQWTAWTEVTTDGVTSDSLSLKAGTSGKRIEGVYCIISGSDRTVRYDQFATVNTIPSQATFVEDGGARNRNSALTVGAWSHNDIDGDAQVAYTLEKRVNGGSPTYWNGVSWQVTSVNITSSANSVTLSSGWASTGDTLEFRVRTADAGGFGPWSQAWGINATAPVNPTLLTPTDGASITVPELIVEWDVADQSGYLLELLDGTGSVTLWSSGWVGEGGLRTAMVDYDLEDGQAYDVVLTTQNTAGLSSTPISHDITVSLTPPPVPTWSTVAVPDEGAIDVTIDNGTPGGGEAAADNNDLYQIIDGVTRRIATNLAPDATWRDRRVPAGAVVTYSVVARTAVGAIARSV